MMDIGLEAYFDGVNHDRLLVRMRKHVDAPDVFKLINHFLKGGVQVDDQKTSDHTRGAARRPLVAGFGQRGV